MIMPEESKDPKSTEMALVAGIKYASDNGLENITIVVPTKKHDIPSLLNLIGEDLYKTLKNSGAVKFGKLTITIESGKTLANYSHYDVLIAIVLGTDMMEKKVDSVSVNCIVYLPWSEHDSQVWTEKWSPKIIQTPKAKVSGDDKS